MIACVLFVSVVRPPLISIYILYTICTLFNRYTDCACHRVFFQVTATPARASHNRRSAPNAFGPRKRPGNSLTLHSKCARNGTSNSGRNPRARHRPLAHQNAPSRALHGPGMAHPRTPPQKRHARVLSTRRDASRDPFPLKGVCSSKHAAPQNSWRSDQPLVHQNASH